MTPPTLQQLADERTLGALLDRIRTIWGAYEILGHHQQGEFHHDLFLHVPRARHALRGEHLVVSTNCNGGVKEVFCFETEVAPSALWHFRCPENPEFTGELPPPVGWNCPESVDGFVTLPD